MTEDANNGVPPIQVSQGVVLFGGWILYQVLMRAANQRGDDIEKLCATLSVTQGFLTSVGNGMRPVDKLSDDFFRACSDYLELPILLVQIIANRISQEDIVTAGDYAGIDMGNILKAARDFTLVKT